VNGTDERCARRRGHTAARNACGVPYFFTNFACTAGDNFAER
jgi:hypothetical protein